MNKTLHYNTYTLYTCLKRWVLRTRLKTATELLSLILLGRAFHNCGDVLTKDLSPYVTVRVEGTRSCDLSCDRSDRVGWYGSIRSRMYAGDAPCRAL